jgi:DNA-binding transcriptional ArsR family regulator
MTSVQPPLGVCLDLAPIEPRKLTDAETAAVAKALGHPIRLQILDLFHARCPRTAGDIAAELPLAQSTVSVHLGRLRQADVVRTLRTGQAAWHCLNRSVLIGFVDSVTRLARSADLT